MEKPRSLDKTVEYLRKNFESKSDEELAGELKMSVVDVMSLRRLGGLFRKVPGRVSAFAGCRRLRFSNTIEKFHIHIDIPEDQAEIIGLGRNGDYEYTAESEPNKIIIKFQKIVE